VEAGRTGSGQRANLTLSITASDLLDHFSCVWTSLVYLAMPSHNAISAQFRVVY
jgi:hypothetical protein